MPTAAESTTPPPETEALSVDLPVSANRFRRRLQTATPGPSMTRQEFADDCDINRIMARFQVTGAINHFAKYSPIYGEFDALDYQTAQNLIIRARQMFDDLPATIRREVATPAGFLEFISNPANEARMIELGLKKKPPEPIPAPPVTPTPPTG